MMVVLKVIWSVGSMVAVKVGMSAVSSALKTVGEKVGMLAGKKVAEMDDKVAAGKVEMSEFWKVAW